MEITDDFPITSITYLWDSPAYHRLNMKQDQLIKLDAVTLWYQQLKTEEFVQNSSPLRIVEQHRR